MSVTLFAKSDVTIDDLLSTWKANGGPSDEEVIEYCEAVSKQLQDPASASQFEENVKQAGVWANQVDDAFDRVTRSFDDMVKKYGNDFPGFSAFYTEWTGYKQTWVTHLTRSRDVASQNIVLLRRFDKIFLEMVQNIKTDQDRLDCIEELQDFTDEKHDDSVEMYQGFQNLKRDITHFLDKLTNFIKEKGVELEREAVRLKNEIEGLQAEVDALDVKIKQATDALIATGACLCLIGVIVAGSVLASYQSDRSKKAEELDGKQNELADVNRKQQALAHLQSDFDETKPDIALICEKLMLFAEIWTSVRNLSVQFREQLRAGMEATRNPRFKAEVALARDTCAPLQAGLEKYATELENHQRKKKH